MIRFQLHADRPIRALLLSAALLPLHAHALPEDAQQPLEIEASSNEIYLDRGYYIYRGTAEDPAVATQGSLRISGEEIIAETSNGVITRVTARGNPARFQQQPEADQPLVHASGGTLVFDNEAGMVIADENAEFERAGNTLTGQHIEYNLETRSAFSDGGDTDEKTRMFFPPTTE